MTLVQLANFIRIAELQSLSKAAAVIRIAQPALSRQVRQLEDELGAPLLVRHAWGVTLTEAGEVLLERARLLHLEADAAREAVHALSASPTGRVTLGVPASISAALLPPLAARLRETYPGLRPRFSDGFSAVLHGRMLAGEVDLAVLYEDRAIGPLHTSPLLVEDLMLIGPPDAVGAAAGVLPEPLVVPSRPNRLRLIIDEVLAEQSPSADAILEVDSLPAIIAMVERGLGYTLLPYSTVHQAVARGALKAWRLNQGAALSRTLLLARPLDRRPSAAIEAVEREIRAVVLELERDLGWRAITEAVTC